MPEGYPLFVNAKANLDAIISALATAGYVNFPTDTSATLQAEFFKGTAAIPGATLTASGRATNAGLTLTFSGGIQVHIGTDALFAEFSGSGLKQIGVLGTRAFGMSMYLHLPTCLIFAASECLVGVRVGIVGLAAFLDHVVMFDHANRRLGFARGRNCEKNPRKGEAGYTTPDHVFAHIMAPDDDVPAPQSGPAQSWWGTQRIVLAVLGSIALLGGLIFAGFKFSGLRIVPATQLALLEHAYDAGEVPAVGRPALSNGPQNSGGAMADREQEWASTVRSGAPPSRP